MGRRLVLLSVVLILMFVAVYHLFTSAPTTLSPPPRRASEESSSVPTWMLYLGAGVVLSGAFAVARRASRVNLEGIHHVNRGDLEGGAERFERLQRRWVPGRVRAAARSNLAYVRVRQGRLAEAIADLEAATAHGKAPAEAPAWLAAAHALNGDLGAAERRVADARAHALTSPEADVIVTFARAVIACRGGQPESVERLVADRWRELIQTAPLMTDALRVVRALALASAGPRNDGEVDRLLRVIDPESDLRWLGARWPEMAVLLEVHRVGRAASA